MKRPVFAALLTTAALCAATPPPSGFDKDVAPVLSQVCSTCHNEGLASGGLNVTPLDAKSFATEHDRWAKIIARLKAGEMPPPGIPGPGKEKIDALVTFVQKQLDEADRTAKPNPGRVVAHRLNRAEYSNTVRDLLGVDFHAEDEFPADDSGYGFDNIGDVLTVSPTLMAKYLSVAEGLASRAVGGDPLPKPGFFNRKDKVRRVNETLGLQTKEILYYDADYVFRVNLTGHRGDNDPPLKLRFTIDGKPVKEVMVPVQISAVNKQGGATHRVSEEVRVFLTGNQHTFKAEFVEDEGLTKIDTRQRLNVASNIFADTLEIGGPYPPAEAHAAQKKVVLCDPATDALCVSKILTSLAHRAYRRPVTQVDVAPLVKTFNQAKTVGYTPLQSLQFAVAKVLVSPQFLFRLEKDPPAGLAARISDVELASRLSYFLWSSMPDEELTRLAETSRLHLPLVLDAQVKRMIADPKLSAFADNFAGQWLQTRSLDAMKPDSKKFPEWNADLKEAMRTETRMFFEAVIRENRSAGDFIDGRYSFLNEQLAKHYGIEGVTGPEFRRVDLKTDQRSGIFTQGSILTVSSYPTRTSVVLRGKYMLDTVLNAPPPPPPPDVPKLKEDSVGVAASLRQQMEQHRADALCASCHSKMDPLGFALENYDGTGKWRTTDGKFAVDSSGIFPNGKSFSGPAQMKAVLKDSMPQFVRSMAEKMLTYSLGRGVEGYDRPVVDGLVKQMAAADYKVQPLILGIVNSLPFQQRRSEAKPGVKVVAQETRK